jgi:hypothetical protein
MKRVSAFIVGLAILSLVPALAGAQGFCFPGMGCGTSCDPDKNIGAPGLYLGYTKNDKGFEATLTCKSPSVAAPTDARLRYPLQGIWVGGSYTMAFSDNVAVMASGWMLVPEAKTATEDYGFPGAGFGLGFTARQWTTKNQWWYADAVVVAGNVAGFSGVVGLRYDFFDTRFQDPANVPPAVVGFSTDTADLTSNGWIPLIGVQYASVGSDSNFLIRIVGVPTLVGRVKLRETDFGFLRIDASGSYNGGGFIEVFTEFNKKMGNAEAGLFVRYNAANGKSTLDLDVLTPGVTTNFGTYDLSFYRSTWTIGGKVGLSF